MSKRLIRLICLCVTLLACLPLLTGCQQPTEETEPIDARQIRNIAELSTLECYYHNVAQYENPGGWFFNHGYKRVWFEYTGVIEIGVDIGQVTISGPDENGVYTITLPEAEVLTDPQIIESSISEPLVETGFLTSVTVEDQLFSLEAAQAEMREAVNNDDALKFQARERAKEILERYVVNYGEAVGEEYTVEFVDAPSE